MAHFEPVWGMKQTGSDSVETERKGLSALISVKSEKNEPKYSRSFSALRERQKKLSIFTDVHLKRLTKVVDHIASKDDKYRKKKLLESSFSRYKRLPKKECSPQAEISSALLYSNTDLLDSSSGKSVQVEDDKPIKVEIKSISINHSVLKSESDFSSAAESKNSSFVQSTNLQNFKQTCSKRKSSPNRSNTKKHCAVFTSGEQVSTPPTVSVSLQIANNSPLTDSSSSQLLKILPSVCIVSSHNTSQSNSGTTLLNAQSKPSFSVTGCHPLLNNSVIVSRGQSHLSVLRPVRGSTCSNKVIDINQTSAFKSNVSNASKYPSQISSTAYSSSILNALSPSRSCAQNVSVASPTSSYITKLNSQGVKVCSGSLDSVVNISKNDKNNVNSNSKNETEAHSRSLSCLKLITKTQFQSSSDSSSTSNENKLNVNCNNQRQALVIPECIASSSDSKYLTLAFPEKPLHKSTVHVTESLTVVPISQTHFVRSKIIPFFTSQANSLSASSKSPDCTNVGELVLQSSTQSSCVNQVVSSSNQRLYRSVAIPSSGAAGSTIVVRPVGAISNPTVFDGISVNSSSKSSTISLQPPKTPVSTSGPITILRPAAGGKPVFLRALSVSSVHLIRVSDILNGKVVDGDGESRLPPRASSAPPTRDELTSVASVVPRPNSVGPRILIPTSSSSSFSTANPSTPSKHFLSEGDPSSSVCDYESSDLGLVDSSTECHVSLCDSDADFNSVDSVSSVTRTGAFDNDSSGDSGNTITTHRNLTDRQIEEIQSSNEFRQDYSELNNDYLVEESYLSRNNRSKLENGNQRERENDRKKGVYEGESIGDEIEESIQGVVSTNETKEVFDDLVNEGMEGRKIVSEEYTLNENKYQKEIVGEQDDLETPNNESEDVYSYENSIDDSPQKSVPDESSFEELTEVNHALDKSISELHHISDENTSEAVRYYEPEERVNEVRLSSLIEDTSNSNTEDSSAIQYNEDEEKYEEAHGDGQEYEAADDDEQYDAPIIEQCEVTDDEQHYEAFDNEQRESINDEDNSEEAADSERQYETVDGEEHFEAVDSEYHFEVVDSEQQYEGSDEDTQYEAADISEEHYETADDIQQQFEASEDEQQQYESAEDEQSEAVIVQQLKNEELCNEQQKECEVINDNPPEVNDIDSERMSEEFCDEIVDQPSREDDDSSVCCSMSEVISNTPDERNSSTLIIKSPQSSPISTSINQQNLFCEQLPMGNSVGFPGDKNFQQYQSMNNCIQNIPSNPNMINNFHQNMHHNPAMAINFQTVTNINNNRIINPNTQVNMNSNIINNQNYHTPSMISSHPYQALSVIGPNLRKMVSAVADDDGKSSGDEGCPCNMRAMVPCMKCGAFCHYDCISPSRLCVTCCIR